MGLLQFEVRYFAENELYWREQYQILYVLKGSITLRLNGREIDLQPEDFVVINSCELYQVQKEEQAAVLCMELSNDLLKQESDYPDSRMIRFCSTDYETVQPKEVRALRHVLANLFTLYSREEDHSHLRSCSKAMFLFDKLFSEYSVSRQEGNQWGQKAFHYLQKGLDHIRENYSEQITLEQTAQSLGISPSYLSSCFRTILGKKFLDILQDIRMKHAVDELLESPNLITEIAYNNGFASPSAFISKFRSQFGVTPKLYRMRKEERAEQKAVGEAQGTSIYQSISKYVDPDIELWERKNRLLSIRKIDCDVGKKAGKAIDPFWRRTACIGWAVDGLSAVVQEQLRIAQKEITFSYLRFHGIFDDDMMVYDEDSYGNPTYNFTYCNMLLDFLHSVGLKPYLELGFVPGKLSQNPNQYDLYHAHICMPVDWDKWDSMVRAFINNCIRRYGMDEVRTWKFTPMMCNHILYRFFTWEEYIVMYQHIWKTLKSIDAELCVGGPGIDSSVMIFDWENSFGPWIEWCKKENCMPDFITIKTYPYDHTKDGMDFWEQLKKGTIQNAENIITDKGFIEHSLKRIHILLKKYGYAADRIAVEAWNTTYSQSDLCNDTCFKAAYIAKNIIENQGNAWCLAYWALSDHMVDFVVQREQSSFRGGFGLFSYDGVKKSGYYAMQLLAKLQGEQLEAGDGYCIARSHRRIQIVLYQYCEYNRFHSEESQFSSVMTDPYYLCREGEQQAYQLRLTGLKHRMYRIEEYRIGREHGGNPYERWIAMGKPSFMTKWQRDYLEQQAQPNYTMQIVSCQKEMLELRYVVQPHDVLLIQVVPEDE